MENLRRRQQAVVHGERLNIQQDVAHSLVAVELLLATDLVEGLENLGLDLGVTAGSLDTGDVGLLNLLLEHLAGEGREVLGVDTEDRDEGRLRGVTVDVGGGEEVGVAEVDVLDTLGRDVLTLGELEDVLLAVDDLEATELVELTDITSVEPAVGFDSLLVLLVVLIVLSEHGGTTHQDLTTRVGLVIDRVVVVRDGLEADFARTERGAEVAGGVVTVLLDCTNGIGLSHTVALAEVVGEGSAEEFLYVRVELSTSADHGTGIVETDGRANLASPDLIVEEVGVVSLADGESHGGLLGVHNVARQAALEAGSLDSGNANGRVEAVEQTGDGDESVGLEDLEIVDETQYITTEESYGSTRHDGKLVNETSVNVSQWQVRQMDIAALDVAHGTAAADGSDRVSLGHNDTLGGTSGTGCVVDNGLVLPRGRSDGAAGGSTNLLDFLNGVNLDAVLGSDLVENSALGVTGLLSIVEGIERNDDLDSGSARSKLEQHGDVVNRGSNDGKLSVVDDVLGSVGAESVVEGDAEQALGRSSEIYNVPLGAVLAPQTNTVLLAIVAGAAENLDDTLTKVVATIADLAKSLPVKLVLPLLGGGDPVSQTETFAVGESPDGNVELVMHRLNLGLNSLEEWSVDKVEVSVNGGSVGALGTGNWDTVRSSGSRRSREELDESVGVGRERSGSHGDGMGLWPEEEGAGGGVMIWGSSLRCWGKELDENKSNREGSCWKVRNKAEEVRVMYQARTQIQGKKRMRSLRTRRRRKSTTRRRAGGWLWRMRQIGASTPAWRKPKALDSGRGTWRRASVSWGSIAGGGPRQPQIIVP